MKSKHFAAFEKIVAFMKENPDTTAKVACEKFKVPLQAYYNLRSESGLTKKRKTILRKKTKMVTLTEVPQSDKLVCVVGSPQSIGEFVRGLS